ncbi:MAG: hypothetical protein P8Z35_02365 [Ignavibacteriaceae bacterium]
MKLVYSILIFISLTTMTICRQHRQQLRSTDFFNQLFNAENIYNEKELIGYKSIYNTILLDAKNAVDQEDDIYDKHKAIFNLLHDKYLKRYTGISYFSKLLKSGDYNCATAVTLYYLLCDDLGLRVNLYESPYHVYITVNSPENNEFIVELTNPVDGFDFKPDEEDYITYLLDYKLITKKEYDETEKDKLYKKFISESHKIKPEKLLSIYYSNLATYKLLKNNTSEAYKLIKKAVSIMPDSANIQEHDMIWSLQISNIETNTNALSAFLLESMDSIPPSNEFIDALIKASSNAIYKNLNMNKFEMADSIYNKLCSVLPGEKLSEPVIGQLDIDVNRAKINSRVVRGEYEGAFTLAGNLFDRYRKNDSVLEIYIEVGNSYMKQLGFSGNFEKLMKVADTLFVKAPGVKSVKETYALSSVMYVVNSGLYNSDAGRAEKILLDANEKLPDNIMIKRALGMIYHELAMAKIRKKDYSTAVKLLKKGLGYYPESKDLKHELKLTHDLLPKK